MLPHFPLNIIIIIIPIIIIIIISFYLIVTEFIIELDSVLTKFHL